MTDTVNMQEAWPHADHGLRLGAAATSRENGALNAQLEARIEELQMEREEYRVEKL